MGMTARARRGVPLWAILLGLIALALLVYPGWRRITEIFQPTKVVNNDCQQDYLVIHRTDGDSVTGADLPLVGPIADLPEFHDCQRFLVPAGRSMAEGGAAASAPARDGLAFGPLVAIWAANKLDEKLSFAPKSADSLVASTRIVKETRSGGGIQPASLMAVPVAVIYDFERNVGYDPLGIRPGFSCLYLWKANTWQARLVSLGDSLSPCLEPMDTTSRDIVGGTQLQVKAAVLDTLLGPEDIPPVARWDWDGKQQYIGIRCGDEWCEIGSPGFTPSAAPAATGTGHALLATFQDMPISAFAQVTDEKRSRVVTVKGWYDEQRLDMRDNQGHLILSDIVGTAVPHPALGSLPAGSFQHKWIQVASLQVTGDYSGKVPLKKGITRLYMCQGTATDCPGVPTAKTCSSWEQDPADPWWAKIEPATGETTVRCVRRRGHGGVAIPAAAARWNWSEVDAKTWVACEGGCCTVN
jgi:hypothetical protein